MFRVRFYVPGSRTWTKHRTRTDQDQEPSLNQERGTRPEPGTQPGTGERKDQPMLRPYRNVVPTVDPSAYVDESAQVIGDVVDRRGEQRLDERGRSRRRELHPDRPADEFAGRRHRPRQHTSRPIRPIVGDQVTVGHGAILHGCAIEDRCLDRHGRDSAERRPDRQRLDRGRWNARPRAHGDSAAFARDGQPGQGEAHGDRRRSWRSILEGAANYVRYRLDYMDQDT